MSNEALKRELGIVEALQRLHVSKIFSVPGTQNLRLFEALRRRGLRTVITTDENRATFAAIGSAYLSKQPEVILVIPGPGFLFALPGIAEAQHDSVPLVLISTKDSKKKAEKFGLQEINQQEIIAPLVKAVFVLSKNDDAYAVFKEALRVSTTGEPGPVYVELNETQPSSKTIFADSKQGQNENFPQLLEYLRSARTPLFFLGQGACGAVNELTKIVDLIKPVVLSTLSGRGIISDLSPYYFLRDFSRGAGKVVPSIITAADAIFVLGAKLSHNGSAGFKLDFPHDKLIHIDSSADVLGANYQTTLSINSDLKQCLEWVMDQGLTSGNVSSSWAPITLSRFHQELDAERGQEEKSEPKLLYTTEKKVGHFFSELQRELPPETSYCVDSGRHQILARKYLRATSPRTLLVPADFQSMGFAIPAAIGAKLEDPSRSVVCIVGDGGFLATGLELSTAVREKLDLLVVVFSDGGYSLLRDQQQRDFGWAHGTALPNIDLEAFASSLGCSYESARGELREILPSVAGRRGVTILEVKIGERLDATIQHQSARFKSILNPRLRLALKKLLGR